MSAEIPQELVEQIARGNGVLFVGAGLSQGAGLPGWPELLRKMMAWAEAHGVDMRDKVELEGYIASNELLLVAEEIRDRLGQDDFRRFMAEVFRKPGLKPTDAHKLLPRIPATAALTSNYDTLLETAYTLVSGAAPHVFTQADYPELSATLRSAEFYVLHVHGTIDRIETVVLGRSDYRQVMHANPAYRQHLANLFGSKTFLFLGFGLTDPDLLLLLDELQTTFKGYTGRHFALMNAQEAPAVKQRRFEKDYSIRIVSYIPSASDHPEVRTFVADLAAQVAEVRKKLTPVVAQPLALAAAEAKDVSGLLEAMGYRITDTKAADADLYFLCDAKWGAEIRQEVVHFVGREPKASDIAALNDAVVSYGAAWGTLLTRSLLPTVLCDLARQRERIQCYTLDEFTDRLADFRPYLQRLIENHEASEIPQYYIPLGCYLEARRGEDWWQGKLSTHEVEGNPVYFKPLEDFVDAWLAEPGRNHLSILGDFGSGKTWFCQRYAYLAAKHYLANPARNRIPILITLRDYSRAYDVEQLITDALTNRYKVGLAAGYKTFARLNEAGRLLLIFDGFDEMERRVSDYRTTVDNFWELAKVVCPTSKVLLTCRMAYFRHRGEEEETLTPRRGRVSVAAGDQVIDLRGRAQFEVLHLLDFTEEDIRLALQKRLPVGWEPVYQKIRELSNLRDLAGRPVLLDMIVKTLPQIQDAGQINQATLYETYVDALLKRRWSEDTDYIPPQGRLFFVQELAWEMYTSQRLIIPFSEFPERVTKHFGLKDDPERAAFFERDVRTQSYLVRDDAGNYHFAHKSFMEYFVARRIAQELGALPPLSKDNLSKQEELGWSRMDVVSQTIEEALGTCLLTTEVLLFLQEFLGHRQQEQLWGLIRAASQVGRGEVVRANAAMLLDMRQVQQFQMQQIVTQIRSTLEQYWESARALEQAGVSAVAIERWREAVTYMRGITDQYPDSLMLQVLMAEAKQCYDQARKRLEVPSTLAATASFKSLVELLSSLDPEEIVNIADPDGEIVRSMPAGEAIYVVMHMARKYASEKADEYLLEARGHLENHKPRAAQDMLIRALELYGLDEETQARIRFWLKEKILPAVDARTRAETLLAQAGTNANVLSAWDLLTQAVGTDPHVPNIEQVRQILLLRMKHHLLEKLERAKGKQRAGLYQEARHDAETVIDLTGEELLFEDVRQQATQLFETCLSMESAR